MIRHLFATLVLAAASFGALAAIDANRASQAELEALPGVGPALSSRIVAERQKAPFKNWTDMIDRVRGVGPGSAAKLSKGGLTVGNASFVAVGAPPPAAPNAPAVKPAAPAPAVKGK